MVFKGKPRFEETPPDDFDPARPYADPVAALEQREYVTREKLVLVETAKIWREKVRRCYRREGVNHYQNCRELVKKYMESVEKVQTMGWGKDVRLRRVPAANAEEDDV